MVQATGKVTDPDWRASDLDPESARPGAPRAFCLKWVLNRIGAGVAGPALQVCYAGSRVTTESRVTGVTRHPDTTCHGPRRRAWEVALTFR